MQIIHRDTDRTVMIVDDELVVRTMMRLILEMSGYTVVAEASDGVEAVAHYLKLRPRITIMDISMPNKNGIDATREIVAIDANAKVVIISGMNCQDLAKTALDAGARDALPKPVQIRALKEVLRRVMQA